ncbi:hypothetical protein PIB30_090130 [Stylosanthes scabra]|uniref:Uncharacterized protein n=1 Tax=Stylosanthes scabra TaxID=79078 RepID=A0ABU6QU49_9FABA|nr:hypothetical protein [Stylosanthes scabra]
MGTTMLTKWRKMAPHPLLWTRRETTSTTLVAAAATSGTGGGGNGVGSGLRFGFLDREGEKVRNAATLGWGWCFRVFGGQWQWFSRGLVVMGDLGVRERVGKRERGWFLNGEGGVVVEGLCFPFRRTLRRIHPTETASTFN